jgi:hypothetical protein
VTTHWVITRMPHIHDISHGPFLEGMLASLEKYSHMWVVRGGYLVILAHILRVTNFRGSDILIECLEFFQINANGCKMATIFLKWGYNIKSGKK